VSEVPAFVSTLAALSDGSIAFNGGSVGLIHGNGDVEILYSLRLRHPSDDRRT
jgi:hypothetical protein